MKKKSDIANCNDFKLARSFYLQKNISEKDISNIEEVSKGNLSLFKRMAHRRLFNEPLDYILRRKFFMGIEFYIDNRVYIPNNESEALIKNLIQDIQDSKNYTAAVLDVGSGCGAIAIAIKKQIESLSVLGCDFHPSSLEVAQINVEKLDTDVIFFESFYVDDFDESTHKAPDYIIANMPYGKASKKEYTLDTFSALSPQELKYMPATATFHPLGITSAFEELINSIQRKKWKTKLYLESGKLPKSIISKIVPANCKLEYIPILDNENTLKYSTTIIMFQ